MSELAVVCGAGGFIGGHLVRSLLDKGYRVRAVDIKGPEDWWQTHLSAENRSSCDLSSKANCLSSLIGADRVYMLACNMGGMGFIENNKALCMLSVLINTHLMMAAKECGVKRHFLSSSACVYSADKQRSPDIVGLKEEDAYPALCEDGYGWAKLFDERMCRHFREDFGIQTRIARFHNIFGPCYDDQTEILTENGFKLFKNLSPSDKVATRKQDGDIEYHTPSAIQRIKYSGEMIHFKSRSYDFMVTPEHAMAVSDAPNGILARVQAKQLADGKRLFYVDRSSSWTGVEQKYHTINGLHYDESKPFERRNRNGKTSLLEFKRKKEGRVVFMDDWLEFLGWYIAEGSYTKRESSCGADYRISIRQLGDDALVEIARVVRRLGFHPAIEDGRVTISSKVLYHHLEPLGRSGGKYIPDYVKSLPARQLRILFTSMMRGDGHCKSGRPAAYYTKSKRLADDFCELALKLGIGTTVSFRPENKERHVGPTFNITLSTIRTNHKISRANAQLVKYDGVVHDVTVENHVIFVRRNGRSAWCGNCGTWAGGREKAPAAICRKVAEAKLSGKHEIEIWGDGNQTRSFTWIDDCIHGINLLMDSDIVDPLNIGSSEKVTINQLVDLTEEIAGVKLERRYKLDAPKGVNGRNSDNTKIKALLNWEPSTPLRVGLEKTYAWVEEQVKASR